MQRCNDLLEKARRSASNLRFAEACALAECLGFVHARTRGSHRIYKRPGDARIVNLQPDRRDPGRAKKRQVEDLLKLYRAVLPDGER